tara:strand:- start:1671 stop:2414 length:744 start_codon:yes stop_codon:yes gene_type:complete
MKLKELKNHELLNHSKNIVNDLDKNIIGKVGRQKDDSFTHSLFLIKELMGDECKTVLEIGTFWGGALLTMMQNKNKSKFVSIDTFKGFYPELIGENTTFKDGHIDKQYGINTKEKITLNIKNHNTYNHKFELVEGSSHDKNIIDYIYLKYPTIDLLFIDGDHTKKGVLQDWNNFSPLISSKGIVIFDDYWVGDLKHRAWNKNKMSFDDGTLWMDVEGAVNEIINSEEFKNNWKEIGLYGDKKIVQKL